MYLKHAMFSEHCHESRVLLVRTTSTYLHARLALLRVVEKSPSEFVRAIIIIIMQPPLIRRTLTRDTEARNYFAKNDNNKKP